MARVNNRTISIDSFEKTAARLANLPGKDLNSPDERKALVREMIDEELLFQQALKESLPAKSERLRREIAREYLVEKIGKQREQPSEREIRNYFEERKNELEKVRASHILIVPDVKEDPASEAKAKGKAEEILAKLRAEGPKADFNAYAMKHSNDPAMKTIGPDLGFFTRDKMVPEFSQAAFAIKKVGDLSGVVKTQYGYHIIKLTGEQRGLDFFRSSIQWQIVQEAQKQKAEALLTRLRAEAKIQVFDRNLARTEKEEKK